MQRPRLIQLVIFLLCLPILVSSIQHSKPNYLQYHAKLNGIEAMIVQGKFELAEHQLVHLHQEYEPKFVKDIIIEAQLSILNNNPTRGVGRLKDAIKKGATIDCLKKIHLLQKALHEEDWQQLETAYPALRKEYLATIDLDLYNEFHKRYQAEQEAKMKPNYRDVVEENFKRIQALIAKGTFPGPSRIGIDNQQLAKSISPCNMNNAKVIATLKHYDYPIQALGEARLLAAIRSGDLHPREFATIYAYEQSRVSELYERSYKQVEPLPVYHFNFPFGQQIDSLPWVNEHRKLFGICPVEVDLKKDSIYQATGLFLQFGN